MREKYKLRVAVVETTNRCNLSCLICGSDSKNVVNLEELSAPEWCGLIDEMKECGLKEVFFSGGEPTLKPGIEEMIEHAADRGLKWGMVSNGLYIPDSQLDLFQERKPLAIGLSVDGLWALHNTLRGNPQSLQMVEKYIQEFQQREIPFSIITTIHKLNFRELFAVAEFVLRNKIYGWQIQLAMPFGRMRENSDLLLSEEEFREACLTVEKIRKILPDVKIAGADCFAWAPAGRIRRGRWLGCSAGLESVGIDALGNVRGCLAMTGCEREGNIKERSFSEIWHDPNLFSYNRHFNPRNTSSFCQSCPKVMICRGGCNAQSFSMTGQFQQGTYCWYKSKQKEREVRKDAPRPGLQIRTATAVAGGIEPD